MATACAVVVAATATASAAFAASWGSGVPVCAAAGCAEDGTQRCSGCKSAFYCSGGCQAGHWRQGGHKQQCKRLRRRQQEAKRSPAPHQPSAPAAVARSGAAAEVARAAVAAEGGAGSGEGACCWICLHEGPDEEGGALLRGGCACRGEAGWGHVACVAKHAVKQWQAPRGTGGRTDGWKRCPTCKQPYKGPMRLGLAQAWSARVAGRPAEDGERRTANAFLGNALNINGQHVEAVAIYREELAVRRCLYGQRPR